MHWQDHIVSTPERCTEHRVSVAREFPCPWCFDNLAAG